MKPFNISAIFSPVPARSAIISNTVFQIIARFISAFNSLVVTVVISRYLGVLQFGDLVKIISFTSLFYMPLDFGLNAIALKLFKTHNHNLVFSHLFILRLVFSVILVLINCVIAALLPYSGDQGFPMLVKQGIYIMSLTIVIQGIIKSYNAILQYHHLYSFSMIVELVNNTLLFVFLYVSVKVNHLQPLLLGYSLCAAAAAVALAYLTRYKIRLIFSHQ